MTSQTLVDLIAGYRWFGQSKVSVQSSAIYAAANLIQTELLARLQLLERKGSLTLVSGQQDYSFSPVAITGATGNGISPIALTCAVHYFQTGDTVTVAGIAGNTAANVRGTVTRIDSSHFSLDGTTGNGAYGSGGSAYHCLLEASQIKDDILRTSPSYRKIRRRTYQWIQENYPAYASSDGTTPQPFPATDDVNWFYERMGQTGLAIGFLGLPNASMLTEFMYYRVPIPTAEDISDTVNPIFPSLYDRFFFNAVLAEVLATFSYDPTAGQESMRIKAELAGMEQAIALVNAKRKFVASADHTALRF